MTIPLINQIKFVVCDVFVNAQEEQGEQVQVAGRAGGEEGIPGEREGRVAVPISQKQVIPFMYNCQRVRVPFYSWFSRGLSV